MSKVSNIYLIVIVTLLLACITIPVFYPGEVLLIGFFNLNVMYWRISWFILIGVVLVAMIREISIRFVLKNYDLLLDDLPNLGQHNINDPLSTFLESQTSNGDKVKVNFNRPVIVQAGKAVFQIKQLNSKEMEKENIQDVKELKTLEESIADGSLAFEEPTNPIKVQKESRNAKLDKLRLRRK